MPFERMQFQYPWRNYQERVLGELEEHLDDERLHVVAAPGSGKTVLGLEVMRRLGQPTLILAPTRAIRDQWIDRLVSLFLPEGEETGWITKDLRNPQIVTVTTYQALHSVCSGNREETENEDDPEEESNGEPEMDPEEEHAEETREKPAPIDLAALLEKAGVKTLVLDEAHHLRHAWWKVLTDIQGKLKGVKTVSLTATPPYDVDTTEWERYETLCGPIDTWIHVPELVARGDLCPHQDHVYLILPDGEEQKKIAAFHRERNDLGRRLVEDPQLRATLLDHPWLGAPEEHVESILEDAPFFSSLLVFAVSCGEIDSDRLEQALQLLGVEKERVPPLDLRWQEILLRGFLQSRREEFPEAEKIQAELRRELKRMGALERRQIQLQDPRPIRRLLFESLGKLDAVVEILRHERAALGEHLRMVVLTDYVRRSEMPRDPEDIRPLGRLGVVPLFESIRRAKIEGVRAGILTGSLVVLPTSAIPTLEEALRDRDLDLKRVAFQPLPHDPEFVEVRFGGQAGTREVALVTEVFGRGAVDVLVGTQALLGEGWDAPSVNTLVLATFVGSYMLSNQMRGRAIRSHRPDPEKTANIWHLVALEGVDDEKSSSPALPAGEDPEEDEFDVSSTAHLGPDLARMVRRFDAFEGPSWAEPVTIETGIDRIDLPRAGWTPEAVTSCNRQTLERATRRTELKGLWDRGIRRGGASMQLRERVETDRVPDLFGWPLLIPSLLWMVTFIVGGTALLWIGWQLAGPLGAPLLLAIPILLLLIRPGSTPSLLIRNRNRAGRIRQLARTLLESLAEIGSIETSPRAIHLRVDTDPHRGRIACRVAGTTPVEQRLFLQSMEELLSDVDSPRYLVVRRFQALFVHRIDYHPVPRVLARRKEEAEAFGRRFRRRIGPCELVYTRSAEGRRILLQARSRGMSAATGTAVRRKSTWE